MESKRSKYMLIALTVICVMLIGLTSINDRWLMPLRTGVGYFLIPVQSGVNRVGLKIYNGLDSLASLKNVQQENDELKEKIDYLTEENNKLKAEEQELARLRSLYELDQEYLQYEKISARVIAKDSGDWFQVFRIDKGAKDGIQVDANVMANGALVGIVTDVGSNYATVRSIIDDISRVGAMSMRTGGTCIVSGDLKLYKQGRLRLTDIHKDKETDAQESMIRDGDTIVTSNVSSKFLPGLLIGQAVDITMDNNQLTQSGYLIPAADFDSFQEVLIIMETKDTGTDETQEAQEQ